MILRSFYLLRVIFREIKVSTSQIYNKKAMSQASCYIKA